MTGEEPKLGRGERLWVAVKAILWFVLTGLALLGLLAIANWAAWVPLATALVGLLVAVPVYLIRRAFASEPDERGTQDPSNASLCPWPRRLRKMLSNSASPRRSLACSIPTTTAWN